MKFKVETHESISFKIIYHVRIYKAEFKSSKTGNLSDVIKIKFKGLHVGNNLYIYVVHKLDRLEIYKSTFSFRKSPLRKIKTSLQQVRRRCDELS